MIWLKAFKVAVKAVLVNNNFVCSICIQNIDSGVLAFANLHGALVSWGKKEMRVYIPRQATFRIPYAEIEEFHEFPCRKKIEIVFRGRNLVSIREYISGGEL